MNKISAYFKDSYHELMEKVSWPTWEQLQSTMMVLVATIVITAIVYLMDLGSNSLLKLFYSFLN